MGQVVGAQIAVADATGNSPDHVKAVALTRRSAPKICDEIANRCGVHLERVDPATAVVLLLDSSDEIARRLRLNAERDDTTISGAVWDIVRNHFGLP